MPLYDFVVCLAFFFLHVFVCISEVRVMKVTCLIQRTCNLISFVNLVLFWHCNVGIRSPPSSVQ
jgi:hypothetical protein